MESVTVTIPKERLSEFYALMSEFFSDNRQHAPSSQGTSWGEAEAASATEEATDAGNVTGKYAPLFRYFKAAPGRELELTFSEMERALGGKLPPSARKHRPCWANSQVSLLGRVWLRAGWRLTSVDLEREQARFERQDHLRRLNGYG